MREASDQVERDELTISSNRELYLTEIDRLRHERGAVILAHNYQRPEIQAIADFTGDSLGLAQRAAEIDAETIVFCGVYFMAETAHILSPTKSVLIPDPNAGCPLADMITAQGLMELKKDHPGTPVVTYVNSPAAVKAVSDICCTSSNAVSVVKSLDADKVIFTPDGNLGRYVARETGKTIIAWPGYCPTHRRIKTEDIHRIRSEKPKAVFMAHPECDPAVLDLADYIGSTSGMYAFARQSRAGSIIVGSEMGMLYKLQLESPDTEFLMPSPHIVCPNMKLTTLKKVYLSLLNQVTQVTLEKEVRLRAKDATERMLAVQA